jgi:para-aminobenzoate synthetase component 1
MTFILENQESQPGPEVLRLPQVLEADPAPAAIVVQDLSPAPDPVDCFRRLARLPHAIFLDSALKHEDLGRYSFLTADPFRVVEVRGQQVRLDGTPQAIPAGTNPLDFLKTELAPFSGSRRAGLPPFQGGAAGVLGYDLNRFFERLPSVPKDDFEPPELSFGIYDWVIAWDHAAGRAWIISTGFPELDAARRRRRAGVRLAQVERWLAEPDSGPSETIAPVKRKAQPGWRVPGYRHLESNFSPQRYTATIRQAIDYIHAGDCFQVNVAQRLRAPFDGAAAELYLRLRDRNAATFGGFFNQGEFVLASASPERFLQLERGVVRTRPIKGTRPRLADAAADLHQKQALADSPKDRAENVMIVDLLRNDLGRVCAYGSVQVPALCQVESYAFVHHLVSEVRGRLRPDQGALNLIHAAFPGGSITGAPKIRAMEIISELEACARGWYCGSLGYLGFDGTMDTNLLIRSFVLHQGWAQFSVGGGIVADSDPGHEYHETWHKAEGMLRALFS